MLGSKAIIHLYFFFMKEERKGENRKVENAKDK